MITQRQKSDGKGIRYGKVALSNLYVIICDNVKNSVAAGMAETNQQLAKGYAHLANWCGHLHPPNRKAGAPK